MKATQRRLEALMEAAHMKNSEELAEQVGCSSRTCRRWLAGAAVVKKRDREQLARLFKVFKVAD